MLVSLRLLSVIVYPKDAPLLAGPGSAAVLMRMRGVGSMCMSRAVETCPVPGGGGYQARAHEPSRRRTCRCERPKHHRGKFASPQGADIPGGHFVGRARVVGSAVKHIGTGKLVYGSRHEHGSRHVEQGPRCRYWRRSGCTQSGRLRRAKSG